MKLFSILMLASFLLLFGDNSHAQVQQGKTEQATSGAPSAVDSGPEDALNRGNPRGSIVGFLQAASKFDFEQAAEYLDLRNIPDEASELGGRELARRLNHILSRAVWLDDVTVSESAEGVRGDGLPEYRDELTKIPMPDGPVPIWMQKVPRGDGENIWKISNRSVAMIPELYDQYSFPAPVERVRGWFPENASFLGFELFKWAIVVAVVLASWPVLYLAGLLLSRLFSKPGHDVYPYVRKVFTGPFVLIGILVILGNVVRELGAGAYAQKLMEVHTMHTIALVWAFWAVINLFKSYQQGKLTKNHRPGAAKLMQPLSTLLKMLVVIFALLFWLNNLGVNITTVLAGLGVGGLAVALALQKPIEDMMGALTIFSQAPLRVGDTCRYGDILGVVEDIGLRTTRIRTLTNTLVSVPNAQIATVEVENLTYRTKIRYWPTLRLRYDTKPECMQRACERIRVMLQDDVQVHDEPLRVRMTDFAEDAILVKVHSFLDTTNFDESLEIAERLNYRIMEILRAEQVRFALPGRTIQLEGDALPSPG